jgi:hypothetical protein
MSSFWEITGDMRMSNCLCRMGRTAVVLCAAVSIGEKSPLHSLTFKIANKWRKLV